MFKSLIGKKIIIDGIDEDGLHYTECDSGKMYTASLNIVGDSGRSFSKPSSVMKQASYSDEISDKQQYAINLIKDKLGIYFNGSTKNDAKVFIGQHYDNAKNNGNSSPEKKLTADDIWGKSKSEETYIEPDDNYCPEEPEEEFSPPF